MVSIKKLTNLESSDSTFRRKKMAQRVGKYKLTKREQETSLSLLVILNLPILFDIFFLLNVESLLSRFINFFILMMFSDYFH